MARRKIRYYLSTEQVARIINNWLEVNKEEVIEHLIKEVNEMMGKDFKTLEELKEFDIHGSFVGGFGFDCGWVKVRTYNKDQFKEWTLDNGKYNAEVWGIRCPYETQSTTCKEIQIKYALDQMKLNDQYYTSIRLD